MVTTRIRSSSTALILWLSLAVACVKLPPNYSPEAQRAANAHQLLQAVQALSQTAINLNALPDGAPGRLSGHDTTIVRDFSLAIADAAQPYITTGSLVGFDVAVTSLSTSLTADALASPTFKAALATVQTALAAITSTLALKGLD